MVKISELQLENVKRIKAFHLVPTENGLTIIGGRNGQGKTSVLDSIAWALGGERYRPSSPAREGSVIPPSLKVTLSNGIVVERKGKNSALTVTDPSGQKGGQQLLNEFIEQLALDLPRFLSASGKEKAETLLKIIGVGDELREFDRKEQQLYQERLAVGRIADQKAKYAKELPFYPNAPEQPVAASELLRQQAAALEQKAGALQGEIDRLSQELTAVLADLETARKSAAFLHDESTAELEKNIEQIDQTNIQVRANLSRQQAEEEAAHYRDQYDALTRELE
ncbi:MAG: AAA family ATPase, partial [Oscillospiraceae bacterium]|nr:AAA family ATPase [Oscillospiraceae bacterium]